MRSFSFLIFGLFTTIMSVFRFFHCLIPLSKALLPVHTTLVTCGSFLTVLLYNPSKAVV